MHHPPPPLMRILVMPLLALSLLLTTLQPVHPNSATPPRTTEIVRIYAPTPADSTRLVARGLDLLEARDGAELFAQVTPAERAALEADGWQVRSDPQSATILQPPSIAEFNHRATTLAAPDRAIFNNGYRTVEETQAYLHAMAASYPQLTTLVDYGNSWQAIQSGNTAGYHLLALRITNHATTGPKPVFFLMAAIHARELVTAEIATRFIRYLLEGYGKNASVTWLLNEHEVVVVPLVNPDGRKLAETGLMQRKNMNTADGPCTVPNQGVDLNRNSSLSWGTVGSSTAPCSETYRGRSAASEPEVAALQQFITSLFPNRPRPAAGTPAPATTTGVLITLHATGDLVLWPWGYTYDAAPNATELARLGTLFAAFNGYNPQQSTYLYPLSGSTDDWAYGELGLAAYTFEIGSTSDPLCSGFMPPYSCLDEGTGGRFWARNLPALLYAAHVARAPYSQPFGPQIGQITVVTDTHTITITADINGRDVLVGAAEISFDRSPLQGATPLQLRPTDGTFDSMREQGQVVLSNPVTRTLVLVQAQSATGVWGPIRGVWIGTAHDPLLVRHIWLPVIKR